YEARMDHDDALRHIEADYARCQQHLQRAATPEAAEAHFIDGLAILERIAAQHTDFHCATVQALRRVQHDGPAETERQCVALLRLFGLESEVVCEQRLAQERREREAA
ncbi:hypothetical protein DQ04_27741000, partial [Trypanosoma grayi]|uniref:hypothetical protein n=1 Tax=Trypanosoma grayi TaxID=71804 RepID=UPI0004F49CC8